MGSPSLMKNASIMTCSITNETLENFDDDDIIL